MLFYLCKAVLLYWGTQNDLIQQEVAIHVPDWLIRFDLCTGIQMAAERVTGAYVCLIGQWAESIVISTPRTLSTWHFGAVTGHVTVWYEIDLSRLGPVPLKVFHHRRTRLSLYSRMRQRGKTFSGTGPDVVYFIFTYMKVIRNWTCKR